MATLGPSRVFVDSNVLYSRTLRDWLCLLTLANDRPHFLICWSEDVLAEVIYHLRRKHPQWSGRRIQKIRDSIVGALEGGLVHEFDVDETFDGRDPHDAHVHAAASACGAEYLLTMNLRDFAIADTRYEVIDPDSFFMLIHDSAPALVASVTREQMSYWARVRDEAMLPEYLERAECPQFAQVVRRVQAHIGGVPYIPTRLIEEKA